ncbi:MarR family winged helix-turn-helix transcriptional regulator [Streptomyces sp. NPDC096132]|uniref:MarR family winged helix-turn-helix transcriptional regulator n=1 Tax=Streptomyces sp. NPDC096132 TaxID=3366075 RepID=UPI0037FEF036
MTERCRALPTAEELRIWRDFIETTEVLRSELAARLQSESALSPGDYAVLLALSETEGRRLRPSVLADRIGWQRSRLSHQLGRMERRGLLRREGFAADSRGAEVVLTDEGVEAFRRASLPHLRDVRELFVRPLGPDELAAAERITAALRKGLTAGSDV